MDPIILAAIALLVVIFLLRMFFGIAKFVFRLIIFVVVAFVVWRVMQGR